MRKDSEKGLIKLYGKDILMTTVYNKSQRGMNIPDLNKLRNLCISIFTSW